MSKQREQRLLEEIAARVKQVSSIWNEAGDEALPKETKQTVITLNKEIEEREIEVKEIRDQRDLRLANDQRQQDMQQPANRLPTPRGSAVGEQDERPATKGRGKILTPGDQFLADPELTEWLSKQVRGQGVTSAQFKNSPGVQVKALITGLSDTSGGALVQNQQLGLIDGGVYQRPLAIRDLITVGQTDSDMVEFVRVTGVTNNAAVIAEATAASGGTGAKPESAMALEKDTEAVKTIAHWVPVTRRALADAAQIRTMIDTFLRYGLEEELEDQMVTGDGTGENFTGILNTSGTTAQAWDTDLLTTTRRARTKVRVTGRAMPTGYVFHPNDWEDLDLLQDNEGRYFFGGPSIIGNPRLWGLPVVESEAMTEGTSVVADWRWAVLWDRMQAQIMLSDSHSDFFIRNLVAILAELRAAFTILRPSAFVEIDLTA